VDNKIKFPYPGLRPFTKKESKIFFGRRDQCIQLIKNMESRYFITVTGQSGSGKSSLVKAGVIPMLRMGTMPQGGKEWYVVDMTPGDDPFYHLSDALHHTFVDKHEKMNLSVNRIQSIVETGPLGIMELLSKQSCLRVKNAEIQMDRKNLLLLIDQFEELFTLCEKKGFDIADRFVSLLLETAAQQKFCIYVVLTMRSDFIGHCSLFEGLPEAVSKGQFLVPKLNRDQVRAAIIGPQRRFKFIVTPELVSKLLNDYASLDASFRRKQDQLPLMQHVLMRMYHIAKTRPDSPTELNLSLYNSNEIKGITKALNHHADTVYESLKTDEKKLIAEIIFRRLTLKTSDNEYVRDRATIGELTQLCLASRSGKGFNLTETNHMEKQVKAVADEFRKPKNCFIYPSIEKKEELGAEDTLNITHESLIRCWNLCRQWADTEAKEADLFQEIFKRAEKSMKGDPYAIGKLLKRYNSWIRNPYHSAAWAERYSRNDREKEKKYKRVRAFINSSKSRKDWKRSALVQGILLGLYCFCIWAGPAYYAHLSNENKVKGHDFFDKTDYENAIASYKDALDNLKIYGNQDAKLELCELVGKAYSLNGSYRNAIQFYRDMKNDLKSKKSQLNIHILETYTEYIQSMIDNEIDFAQNANNELKEIIQELETSLRDHENTFIKARGTDPDQAPRLKWSVLTYLAMAYKKMKDFKMAHEYFEKAVRTQTNILKLRAQSYNDWALLYLEEGVFHEATERFIVSTHLQPGNSQYYMTVANSLYKYNNFDGAIRFYNKAKKLDKENPGIYSGLAFSYKKKNDIQTANQNLKLFKEYAGRSKEKNIKERINRIVNEYDTIE
jgi:tetratricopeptide (TPR) repeat protein